MRSSTATKTLPSFLLAACLFAGDVAANAGTWSSPVFFTTGTTSQGGQSYPISPNAGGGYTSGYYRAGAQMQGYGVMIYSANRSGYPGYGGDPYPLPSPPVNDVIYAQYASAQATLNFSWEAPPSLYTYNTQVENHITSQIGLQSYYSDSNGTYRYRDFSLTYDSVHNQWILTGPTVHFMALASAGDSDYVSVTVRLANMTFD